MAKYSDILIENDDVRSDEFGSAVIITDRDVIVQDLIHAIRESGYLIEMVGERDPERRRLLKSRIIDLAEEDLRIIPGSISLETDGGKWLLAGETYEFGVIRSPVWN